MQKKNSGLLELRLLIVVTIFIFATASSGTEKSVCIAFIPGQITDPFYIGVYNGVKRASEALGTDLIYDGAPEWNIDQQIAVLKRVIIQKPSVILISPTDNQLLIEPLKKAHQLGIKIITIDTYIGDGKYQDKQGNGDFPLAHISSDNIHGGRIAAKALATAIGKQGTVYISKGSKASTTEMREYGFKLEMKRYRNIKILETLICHENPETAATQLIQVYRDHPTHRMVTQIMKSATRTAEICRDILSVDPQSSASYRVNTDLNVLVEKVSSLLRDVLPLTISIKIYSKRTPLWYYADAWQFQHAILNLGFNAADAMPEGGILRITLEEEVLPEDTSTAICIKVEDTGRGIPVEIQASIFDCGISTKSAGYGIGLANVKQIVASHKGTICVTSNEGEGACFTILLPGQEVNC